MINMKIVLVIARREVDRFRSRFQGSSRKSLIVLLGVAIYLSYLAFGSGATVIQSIYRIGISPNGPIVDDARFTSETMDVAEGQQRLADHSIDVYVHDTELMFREDDRSQYAVGALKQYFDKERVFDLAERYPLEQAFPLRVSVDYIVGSPGAAANVDGQSVSARLELLEQSASAPGEEVDDEVSRQYQRLLNSSIVPEFKLSGEEIVIPSLTEPPIPFTQVVIAFLYVLPIAFISVFFTSSFMDEKIDKRITVLLAAPIKPIEVILGKMLPYFTFSLATIVLMTLLLRGNVFLTLAIFFPVVAFMFAVYLMVPLLYRTFRDTTFISMLAITLMTSLLVFPAMFSGLNDFSYLSPLTLVVHMYRGELFGIQEYLFASTPMILIFFIALYVSSKILNEEFLMAYQPITRKLAEAIFLLVNHQRPYLSIILLSLLFIPIIYLIQLVVLAIALNFPLRYAVLVLLGVSILFEELAKSIGVMVMYQKKYDRPVKQIFALAFVSALGFLIGEKLLLYLSLSVVSDSALSTAMFSSGFLLIPLAAHFVFTSVACLLHARYNVRYIFAIVAAAALHMLYNVSILGVSL